jgi:hypothetical protein
MSQVLITKSKLDSLANTIASKASVAAPLTIAQMETAVRNIPTGGGGGSIIQDKDGYLVLSRNGNTPALISKSITANGTYDAEDDNADGYSSVSIDVSGEPPFVSGAITVVNNTASDLALQDLGDIYNAKVYADFSHCFMESGEAGYEAISAPAHSSTVFYTVNVKPSQMYMEIMKPYTYLFTGLVNMSIDDSNEWWDTINQTDQSLSYAVTITIN